MKKRLRGFTFIEVILYLALFSFLGTALFEFTWDTLELREQGGTERTLTEEARFATERIKYLIRNSSIDAASSVWDSVDSKLVLDVLGSSDTITIERQNERVVMQVSGQDAVPLQSQGSQATTLLFEQVKSPDELTQYVDMTLTLETLLTAPSEYTTSLTLQTGIFVRNFGL